MGKSDNWFDQGMSFLESGDFDGAIAAFDKAIAYNQSPKEAWFNRGIACAQVGKYREAVHSFDQTLLHDPDHDNAKKAREVVLAQMEKEKAKKPAPSTAPFFQRSRAPSHAPRKPEPSPRSGAIRNPWFAVIFSFLFIGWGQWYNGQRWKGLGLLALSVISSVFHAILMFILGTNIAVSIAFFLAGTAIWLFGMYDSYITAVMINRGEVGFTCKSRLFWVPVFLYIVMILGTILLAAVIASFVFGMAGNVHHDTKVVAATAMQTSAGSIQVTYQGGRDAEQVRIIMVEITDSEGSVQTGGIGDPGSMEPLKTGSSVTLNGRFIGKDHVVATALFQDNTNQVILDAYV